jgi:hypothetical protein
MARPVPAGLPPIRYGRSWIFFSLRLTMRTRSSRSAAAKLPMAPLEQRPDALLREADHGTVRVRCAPPNVVLRCSGLIELYLLP